MRFFRLPLLGDALLGEIGVGVGRLQGKEMDYETLITPLDWQFFLAPVPSSTVSPYLFAGIGGLRYELIVGQRSYNMTLSKKRADAVKDWLVKKGISASRITTKGHGPDKPIAPNTTAEGRAKNRRIEFLRTK